jgi:hypothetical protein
MKFEPFPESVFKRRRMPQEAPGEELKDEKNKKIYS